LRAGRAFSSADNKTAPPVVIVNETFARQYWPGQSAFGKKVTVGRRADPALVIGVAADVKNQGLEKPSLPQLYLPFPQLPWSDMNLLVRTEIPPQAAIEGIRAAVATIDPEQPITNVETAEGLIDTSRAQPRFTMMLLAAFSASALMLAVIGLYGVLSYRIAQRRQEFGIRLALGAEPRDILRMMMRQGITLVIQGIVAGLCAALLLTRALQSSLYDTGLHDITTFIAAPVVFLAVAALASYLPARRAMKVDPVETLR
jgi:putative ABC transport system permease protein